MVGTAPDAVVARGGPWADGRRHHGHHHVGRKLRHLRRSPDNRVLGGVCGAVSAPTGIDVTWVRIGFVLAAIASGVMVLVYAVAWLMIPMEGESSTIFSRAVNDRRGIRLVIAILIPVLIAVQSSPARCTSASSASSAGPPSSPSASSSSSGATPTSRRRRSSTTTSSRCSAPTPTGGAAAGSIVRIVVGALIGAGGIALLVVGHTTIAALRPVGGAALVIAAA